MDLKFICGSGSSINAQTSEIMEFDSRRKRRRNFMGIVMEEAPVSNNSHSGHHRQKTRCFSCSRWPAWLWLVIAVTSSTTTTTTQTICTLSMGTSTWRYIQFPMALGLALALEQHRGVAAAASSGEPSLRSRRRAGVDSAANAEPLLPATSAAATSSSDSSSIKPPKQLRQFISDFNDDDEPPSYFGGGNRNPLKDQYHSGWVPEKNEEEIDCSLFLHLDELPPLCEEKKGGKDDLHAQGDSVNLETPPPTSNETTQVQGGDDSSITADTTSSNTIESTSEDDETTLSPTSWEHPFEGLINVEKHSIRVRLSLGIQNHEALTDVRTRAFEEVTHHVIGRLWNRYLEVLEVIIPGQIAEDDDEPAYFEMELDAVEWALEVEGDPPGDDGDDAVVQKHGTRSKRNSDRRNFSVNGTNLITRKADDAEERDLVAILELTHSHMNIEEGWEQWLQLSIEFAVFWPDGSPMNNRRALRQIHDACQHVLDTTIKTGKFWKELRQDTVEHYGENWALKQSDWKKEPEKAFIAAVAIYGEEYFFATNCTDCPLDNASTGKEDSWERPSGPFQYVDSVNTSWGVREWFGLVMGAFTSLIATLLTVSSVILQNRQATKAAWGLTEQGVGELLEVGWSYQLEKTGQLYLKIYKKSHLGYGDEDSMLPGEVPDFNTVNEETAAVSGSPVSQGS